MEKQTDNKNGNCGFVGVLHKSLGCRVDLLVVSGEKKELKRVKGFWHRAQ